MLLTTESQLNRDSVPVLEVQAAVSSSKAQRIPALDFTKGTLVLIMVLYHWINYFIGPQWGHYQYLRFLTPGFIFISGFMVSNVYLSKYDHADSRLSKRLFTRGIKLLVIFVALNITRVFVIPVLYSGVLARNPFNLANVFTIFVSGNSPVAGDKVVAFPILVPISYLLIFSGALMFPYRLYRRTFHFACLLLLLCIVILGLFAARSTNLEMVAIGMLGVLSGFIPIGAINSFVRHRYGLAFAYLCYVIAITIWNTPFTLEVVGVLLSLMAIYLVGSSGRESGAVQCELILLGNYSLFGYISQIAILQILRAGFRHVELGAATLCISFLASLAFTIISVEVLNRARERSASVDRLYKAVFA